MRPPDGSGEFATSVNSRAKGAKSLPSRRPVGRTAHYSPGSGTGTGPKTAEPRDPGRTELLITAISGHFQAVLLDQTGNGPFWPRDHIAVCFGQITSFRIINGLAIYTALVATPLLTFRRLTRAAGDRGYPDFSQVEHRTFDKKRFVKSMGHRGRRGWTLADLHSYVVTGPYSAFVRP